VYSNDGDGGGGDGDAVSDGEVLVSNHLGGSW
jgi:hypothetical protein